jgi:hypothetical protein
MDAAFVDGTGYDADGLMCRIDAVIEKGLQVVERLSSQSGRSHQDGRKSHVPE